MRINFFARGGDTFAAFRCLNPGTMAIDIEAAYRAHGPMVLRRCRRLLRDEGKALDAMHDVFVELLRRQTTLEETAPAALLMRVATNVCLNRLRFDRRHPVDRDDEVLLQIAAQPEDADGGGGPEGRLGARRFLDRLFAREQPSTLTIAVLHHVDHLTLEEVAREVGLSVSGVRKRLRTLRARIPSLEGEPS
jgi:RNA polymerase sigma-70 factor (ECF subfamily)